MHSWLTRCSIGLTSTALVVAAWALPAHAAGADIVVSGPVAVDAESTTEEVSEEVQVEQTAVEPESPDADAAVERRTVEPFRMAGVTWSADSDASDVTVRVQVRVDGAWGDWQTLDVEESIEGGRPGSAPLWTDAPADGIAVDVSSPSGPPQDVQVTTIDPGQAETPSPIVNASYSPEEDEVVTETASDGTPSVVPMPAIITRAQWKAGPGTTCDTPRTRPSALGVVMHHTAGSNTYSKAESAALVRSYQTYHVKGHGWCDIGYNFLVDRFGQIFEGRKGGVLNQVRAAHSGVDAVNQYATGVSMMGHFDHVQPSEAMKTAVVQLVGWRMKLFGTNPKGRYSVGGKSYDVINGHRDVKATACPGKHAYAWLSASGGLRDRVAAYISKAASAASTPDLTKSLPTPATVRVVSAGPTSVTVHWTSVAGAPGYRLRVSPTGGTAGAVSVRTTATSATITGLTARRDYKARVAVVDHAAKQRLSPYTKKPFVAVRTKSFPAPTGIRATARGKKALKLTWTAQAGAPGYRVQLVKHGQTKPKRYVQTTTNAAVFKKLEPNTRYQIRVTVVNPATKERFSAYTKAPFPTLVTKPKAAAPAAKAPATSFAAPTGVKALKRGKKALRLTWGARAGAPGYRVQLVEQGTGKKRYVQTTSNQVLVKKLRTATTYRVRVAVVNTRTKQRFSPYTAKPFAMLATRAAPAAKPAPSARNTATPSAGAITFKGHGYGHGIGMSQYGAEGGARAGQKYDAILRKYYAGTTLDTRSATIRALISAATSNALETRPKSGLALRTLGNNTVLSLPATSDGQKISAWKIEPVKGNATRNGLYFKIGSAWHQYRSFPADAQFEGPATIGLVMPNGKVQQYRGALRSTRPSSGSASRATVNVLDLEDYIRGVVPREMPASWSLEALKAQAVAARTFASRYLGSSKHYDICDTTSCQVYGGVAAEHSRTNTAIDQTRGRILTYGGAPALTQYSSSSGGYTNVGSTPYLKPAADPWDGWSGNKNHSWSQKVTAATIQKKYPKIGKLRSLTVTRRNGYGDQGGRVLSLTIAGAKGSQTITGVDARWAFGLKSDWFGF